MKEKSLEGWKNSSVPVVIFSAWVSRQHIMHAPMLTPS